MIFAEKWCFAYRPTLTFRLWVWLEVREGFAHLSSTHRVPQQGLAQASGSPDKAYLASHCMYVECRPVCRLSAFKLPRAIWWGITVAPVDEPPAEEVQTIGKGSRGRCTQCMPPPCSLRTTSFEARYSSGHLSCPVLPTKFAPVEGWAQTTPRGCRWVRHSSRRALARYHYTSRQQATNIRFCQNWLWLLLFVHIWQLPSSQPLRPSGGTQRQWYHQRTRSPLL